ncbi:olfactory receptor 10A7-like [Rhinoderma darwinii]|uniref:olfactory receptor 10A7-like n=1 Tax=Rhinoderma darwinii TaxID=43563 RepID=UPI003F661380
MCGQNQTMAAQLVLLGFGNLHQLTALIFLLFLVAYTLILSGNILIILLITVSPRLCSPMYFFLCNLSSCEILLTTAIIPNMLCVVAGGRSMSLYGCITQLYIYASSGSVECLLLTVMAFDRYLAICNPLRYLSIMNYGTCKYLAIGAWLIGFILMSVIALTIGHLHFCASEPIDHFFCDLDPLLKLTSNDTYLVEVETLILGMLMAPFPFLLILLSYMSIFYTILRIPSKTGRQKTFSTCSSHLASVCTYFGSISIIYLFPSQQRSMKVSKILSLLYTVLTPLFNPFIYSLRNKELKHCFTMQTRYHYFKGKTALCK